MNVKVSNVNVPNWQIVTVQSQIPEPLQKLDEMARNMWWTWNNDAFQLFRNLNPELFKTCKQNVIEMDA